MKKIVLFSALSLALFGLAACSSSSEKTSEKQEAQSVVKKSDDSQYDGVVKELKALLDKNNNGAVNITIRHDVVDGDFPDGHTVIAAVTATESGTQMMKELVEAKDSNTATDDQVLTIQALRQSISDIAKKLPNDSDEIDFGYEIAADQTMLVAASTKTKDIIPITE